MKQFMIAAALASIAYTVAVIGPTRASAEQTVPVCHRPSGNPSASEQLFLGAGAAQAHLRNHELDTPGMCTCSPDVFSAPGGAVTPICPVN